MKMFIKDNNYVRRLSNCIRVLSADAVEQARSGHPGMPLGFADVMTVFGCFFLRFNPNDPKWFNRDRLILSAGHGSMLLYSFYYLTGYPEFTLEQLKNFRQLGSLTPGHPEYGLSQAIEVTTGPLGQGFGTAIGMAIAEKKYKAVLGDRISDHKIYCIVGDGCLMEGISYEAMSMAGHLNLNNLVVLFDNNNISIDGPVDLVVSEDHLKKFTSCGWEVDEIDGHDFEQIFAVFTKAQNVSKPYLISCKTVIGYGSGVKAGSEKAHGAPLGISELEALKHKLSWEQESFFIPEELLKFWRLAWRRNEESYLKWQEDYKSLTNQQRSYLANWQDTFFANDLLKSSLVTCKEATRVSSGKVIEDLLAHPKVIVGSADLSLSNSIKNNNCFIINKDNFSGNFIHYGVREHLMGAVMNGLAIEGFIPLGGTFLVFSDYMRPSIRLAAIMSLKVIYVMTHDSIGVGEDGPTHQPIEHLASLRAMPNLLVFRPADMTETLECWHLALTIANTPVLLALTRQTVPQIRSCLDKVGYTNLSAKGAYIIEENKVEDCEVVIFASGSEVAVALVTRRLLNDLNITVRVVSVPCMELLWKQPQTYIDGLSRGRLKVAIEAACSFGWHRIIGRKGLFFGIEEFGSSAPSEVLYQYYGLTPENIAKTIALSK